MAISIKAGKVLLNNKYSSGGRVLLDNCKCCCRCYGGYNRKTGTSVGGSYSINWPAKPLTGVCTVSGFTDFNHIWTGSVRSKNSTILTNPSVHDIEITRMEQSTEGYYSINTTKVYNLREAVVTTFAGLPISDYACSTAETSVKIGDVKHKAMWRVRRVDTNRTYELHYCRLFSVYLEFTQLRDAPLVVLKSPVSSPLTCDIGGSNGIWYFGGSTLVFPDVAPVNNFPVVNALYEEKVPGRNDLWQTAPGGFPDGTNTYTQCQEWSVSHPITSRISFTSNWNNGLGDSGSTSVAREKTVMVGRMDWRLYYPSPPSGDTLETEGGVTRVTESGDVRIIE